MDLPDGSFHPNNGFCVQHRILQGKDKTPCWVPLTTAARWWNKARCEGMIAGLQHAEYDKELRLLDRFGNVLQEWLHKESTE